MKHLSSVAGEILGQLDHYLGALPDEDYAASHALLSGASIGEHTRHIIDGFLCMMRQLEGGTICYDYRERDPLVSHHTTSAREHLESIQNFLSELDADRDLQLEICYREQPVQTPSTLAREMIHNIEHTIHHLAIIKIALKAYHPELGLPAHFGVAPSTLRFWEEIKKDGTQAGILST